MPWLIQEQDVSHSSEALLFVHIPRTGGTSLTSDYKVPSQSRRYLCCCQKLLITYFFYRYRLLEKSNFPMKSYENLYVVCSWIVAIVLGILFSISHRVQGLRDHSLKPLDCVHIGACYMPYIMAGSAFITHCLSTYVFTAPSLRFDVIRRFYLWFWHLTGAYSNEVLGGTNKNGFLMHLTTEEMLRYGYITSEQLERVSSFGIVRNPYARMVSMYMYNRFTQAESFKAYVRRSYRAYQDLNDRGRWGAPRDGEWEVFCHRLPMHLFTHDGARQLVGHVVRMEDFSVIIDPSRGKPPRIFARDPKQTQLPPAVYKALKGMTKVNSRPLKSAWQDQYDDETAAMVYEMYAKDFEVFGYPKEVPPSPPLKAIARQPTRRSFWDYRPQPKNASVTPACSTNSLAGARSADSLNPGGSASVGDLGGLLGDAKGDSGTPVPTGTPGRMSPGPPSSRIPSADARVAAPTERTALMSQGGR